MFTRTILATVVALGAAPVLADGVSQGAAMQASVLGVQPGVYTIAQLVDLRDARTSADLQRINFILDNPGGTTVSTSGNDSVSSGDAQLALSLGLKPGAYTTNEMQNIQWYLRHDNMEGARAILNHDVRDTVDDSGVVNPGKAQLAASLGLDPADYTTAQLAALKATQLEGTTDN